MKKQKGAITLGGVLLCLLVIALIVGAIFLFRGLGGGFGGGKGEGEGSGNVSETDNVSSDSEASHTEVSTEQMRYLVIVISENDYLFQNTKYSSDELEQLIVDVKLAEEEESLPIKITDDNASQRAYNNLKNALKDSKIRFIDEIIGDEKVEST